eukprot:610412-Hanusia_phi.AAC.2
MDLNQHVHHDLRTCVTRRPGGRARARGPGTRTVLQRGPSVCRAAPPGPPRWVRPRAAGHSEVRNLNLAARYCSVTSESRPHCRA